MPLSDLYAAERNFLDIAGRGTLEEVEEAIANGADVNMRTLSGITPLIEAAHCKNDLNVVRVLLSSGADVNATDTDGMTPLIYAQAPPLIFFRPKHNSIAELTRILLDAGADINAKSKPNPPLFRSYPDLTVLMWAAIYNRADAVKLLIDRGVKINAKNSQRRTAYNFAVKLGLGQVADILFFENNVFKHNLALLFYLCFEALPFLFSLVWLYRRYTLRFFMDGRTLFASLSLGILWIVLMEGAFGIQTRLYKTVPLVKKICFLLITNGVVLWRLIWTWDPKDAISRWSPFRLEGKIVSSFLFTCFILVLAWTVDPWIDHYSNWRKMFYVIPWLLGIGATYGEWGHKI